MVPSGFTLPVGYFAATDRPGVIGVGGHNIKYKQEVLKFGTAGTDGV